MGKKLIKEVPNIKYRGGKHYMASEFEPSKELTGGAWYVDGKLDKDFIGSLKDLCLKIIGKLKVATAEGVYAFFKRNRIAKVEVSSQQIAEILRSMVLDNEILEVKSTGLAEYHSIPIGEVCYRCVTGGGIGQAQKTGTMASIPCGVCPGISMCTPDGIISPSTCVYYTEWFLIDLLSEKMPELLDYDKDLGHLEAASKIQLKNLAEEMQAVSKGLEKVELELTAAENDGAVSSGFQKVLKSFLDTAEAEVRSLISLYSEVGRNADSPSQYFGEDPARCPFEQVTQILSVFTKMFNKARDENAQQADAEKKKLEKEALKEQAAANSSARREGMDADHSKDIKTMLHNLSLSSKHRETRNGDS